MYSMLFLLLSISRWHNRECLAREQDSAPNMQVTVFERTKGSVLNAQALDLQLESSWISRLCHLLAVI